VSFVAQQSGGTGPAEPARLLPNGTGVRPAGRAGRAGRRLLAAAAACGLIAGLFACYLRLSATFPADADGASNALEAWALLHGNWLLRGWTLTDVSFYTTELPEYAAVELVRGLSPAVVHTAAAITYTLLVVAAAALARGRARGREGWTRALVAAGIMVAPQLGNGIHVLLSQPDHVGTQVPILGLFLLLDRAPRRWRTVTITWALLTVVIVADKIALVDAAVPLAFVGLLHATWAIGPGARRAASRLRAQWFELSLAAAAAAAAGTAVLLSAGISRLGGFTVLPVPTGLVTPARLPGHFSLALHGSLTLYGADVGSAWSQAAAGTTAAAAAAASATAAAATAASAASATAAATAASAAAAAAAAAAPGLGWQTVLAWLHAPGVALAVAAFAVVVWRVPCPRDLVGDVLAVAIVVNLAGFIASVIPATAFDTREMAALLPFGAVLAGRVFGPRLARSRAGTAALALAGAGQLLALGYGITRPPAVDPERALAGWLAARHLTSGLGTFTDANLTTLDSGGAVRLAAVSWRPPTSPAVCPQDATAARSPAPPACTATAGGAVARLYQSSDSWYDPRAARANFIVTGTADGSADVIPRADILGLAGPPARTYQFQSFTVLVWNENLLPLLGDPPSATAGDIGHP
jgi:hypothetical protein